MGHAPPSRVAVARHRAGAWVLGAALLAGGCVPPVLQVAGPDASPGFLAFLQDGRTTREEALLRLGTPNARLEGERILTYAYSARADWAREGRVRGGRGEGVPGYYRGPVHSLVLVFGTDGVLVRHSLVVSR